MQRSLFVFLASVLAVALAQQNYNVYQLSNGVSYPAALAIQPSINTGYSLDLYSLYVPENATFLNVTITSVNEDICDGIRLVVRTNALPCTNDDTNYPSDQFLCSNGLYGDAFDGSETYPFYAGYSDALVDFTNGGTWYFGITRYFDSDYAVACPYTIQVTSNNTCPTGTIGMPYALTSEEYSQCSPPYTFVNANLTTPQTYNFTTAINTLPTFKFIVPQATGAIAVTLISSTADNTIIGKSYGSPLDDEDYNCYFGSSDQVGNVYVYSGNCYTPRAGPFFIVIENTYEAYNCSLTFQVLACPTGFGGFNCTYSSTPLNTSITVSTIVIPHIDDNYLTEESFVYRYIDIPAGYAAGQLLLSAASAQDGEFYQRRDGYPEDSSIYGYEDSNEYQSYPATYSVNQFEWSTPGRIYFGFACETVPSCTVVLNLNASITSGTTGTTGLITTTGTTGISTTSTTGTTGNTTLTTAHLTTSRFNTTLTTQRFTTGLTTSSTTSTTGLTTSTSTSTSGHTSSAFVVVPSVVVAVFAALLAFF